MSKNGVCLIVFGLFILLLSGLALAEDKPAEPAIKFDQVETVYRSDITSEFGEDLAVQMKAIMGSMADMFKFDVWVYEITESKGVKEDKGTYIDTVLEGHPWPAGVTETPLQDDEFGRAINRMLDYEEELNAIWGNDWSSRAKEAAKKYEGKEVYSKSYVYSDPTTGVTFSITVTSPFGSIRTFEIYQGIFIIINQMSVKL